MGLGYGLHRFRQLGIAPAEIRLTGGGSQSPAWRQICSDVFGVPTVCLATGEGAALGAGIQACWAYGHANGQATSLQALTDRLVAVDERTRTEPQPAAAATYQELMGRQADLTRKLHSAGYL